MFNKKMTEKKLSIEDIGKAIRFSKNFSRMGDEYVVCSLSTGGNPIPTLASPIRLSGLTLLLCRKGTLDVEINLAPFHISPGALVVISPDTLTKFHNMDYENLDISMLFVGIDFLKDVNIDLNAINVRSLIEQRTPIVKLTRPEFDILNKHLELLELHADNDTRTIFSRNIARSLVAATTYRLLQFNFDRINNIETPAGPRSRRTTYVQDFMRLVHHNYTRERSVAFYADQLCISPKYLSLLIKETTGRSAVEWINEFVIIEAKNLLRFSGKNIQQVAYALNFNNQSSFGKYFKNITGQSPSQYQKT